MSGLKIFISYSHDSSEHSERVLHLAWALRRNGIDVELDQFHNEEIVDWPRWCNEQTSAEHSDFVVCICTAEYRRRIEGKVPPEKGKGVHWEGSLLDDDLYDAKGNSRLIPILFDGEPESSVPRFLRGWTHSRMRQFALDDSGYEHLLRLLTGQAKVEKNALGPVPVLSTERPPTVSQSSVDQAMPGTPGDLPTLLQDMLDELDEYPSAESSSTGEDELRLRTGQPLCDIGRLVVRHIPDARTDRNGDPNFPGEGGKLWYRLLRTSRNSQIDEEVLEETAARLSRWLRQQYGSVLEMNRPEESESRDSESPEKKTSAPIANSSLDMSGFTLAMVTLQAASGIYGEYRQTYRDRIRTYRARVVAAAADLGLCSFDVPSDAAGRALINWLVANHHLSYESARDLSVDEALRIAITGKRKLSQLPNPVEAPSAAKRETFMTRCTVLFLAANPLDCTSLELDEEARDIEQRVLQAKHRDAIDFVPKFAVRREDLQFLLNQHKPHVLHFSGHGAKDEIYFKDADGSAKPVSKAALKSLLKAVKDNIRLVILNACYTGQQADSITAVIDCAIGMKRGIGDEAARVFAASFYLAIGFGRSVQNAYDQAIASLQVMEIPEDKTPVLSWHEGIDPDKVVLVEQADIQANP